MTAESQPATARLTARRVVDAVGLVGRGVVYDLGLALDETIPQGNPGAFTPFSLLWRTTPESADGPYQYAAETIIGCPHVSTHIDALVHCQAEGRIFGGTLAADARDDRGFKVHGAETISPIIGRGVVLDVAGHHGTEALADGYEITPDDVDACLASTGQSILPGDVALVRTGKIREFATDAARFQAGQPGVGVEAATSLYERGMSVLGTDTTGTEPLPFKDAARTTHRAMLVERGVHLVENLDLSGPCADGVTVGLFVCLPLKLTGGTGSWVRPVLVV